jgi:L-rhamnonate dehydratase
MRRRTFLGGVAALPAAAGADQTRQPSSGRLKIAGVEIWHLEGHRQTVKGVNHQFQVNQLDVYDDLRPRPYHDGHAEPAVVPVSALYLKIKTDSGLEGIYGPVDREAAVVVDQELRRFITGKDPLAGETLWDQMFRSNRHSRRGLFMMAISAVDNALWDLRGRYFGVPVYRLLGGPTRDSVEAYASALGYSLEPAAVRTRALALRQEGFRYQKWFMAHGPGEGPDGLASNVSLVKELRETLGDGSEIMFDAYSGWDLNYALAWAKLAEQYRPHWIEEAVQADKIESFATLRRATSIPVASGEHLYGRWEAHQYLHAGALNVLQCDPEWCGGVSELVKICAIASLYDVQVIPHGHGIHAALHVVASQPPMTCPLVEWLVLKMAGYHHFEKEPPHPDRAHFALPERPGFGIELNPATIEKQTQVHWS